MSSSITETLSSIPVPSELDYQSISKRIAAPAHWPTTCIDNTVLKLMKSYIIKVRIVMLHTFISLMVGLFLWNRLPSLGDYVRDPYRNRKQILLTDWLDVVFF